MASPATHAPDRRAVPVAMAVMGGIWGSTYLVVATGLDDLPPLTSAAIRFLVAGGLMALAAPLVARREGGREPGLRLSVIQGICNFAYPYALTYRAQEVLPSGVVAVMWALFPVCTAMTGGWLVPGERFLARQWLALAIALAGVGVLFRKDIAAFDDPAITQAALWLLTAPLVSALGTGWIKRAGAGASSAYLNRNGMLVGAGLLMGAAWLLEDGREITWTASAIGSIAYLSLFGTCVTFGLYFWAVRHAPVWQLSLVALITPALALVLGAVFRDERITGWTVGGLGLILTGVGGVLAGSARREGPARAPGR